MYHPILTRILRHIQRCLTQPDRPEPAPDNNDQRFPQMVDYIVRTDKHGNRTEYLRMHVDIDATHKLGGEWPLADLNLVREVDDDRSA